jgi:hypothetical protein
VARDLDRLHQLVEPVRHVVVVGDGLCVPSLRVAAAAEPSPPAEAGAVTGRRGPRAEQEQPAGEGPSRTRGRRSRRGGERRVDGALDVEVAGHVGPAEPELTRSGQDPPERVGRTDHQRGPGADRARSGRRRTSRPRSVGQARRTTRWPRRPSSMILVSSCWLTRIFRPRWKMYHP